MVKLNKLCKFGQECAYHHVSDNKEILPDEDISKMKQKMDILEETIHNQAEKIKNLEADMKTQNEEQVEHVKKFKQIEKVVHALTRKVLELEKETTKLKKTKTASKDVEGLGNSELIKEKQIYEKTDISDNTPFNPISSSSPKDKSSGSQPKEKKYSDKKTDIKENMFTCKECDYKTKKEGNLKKHMSMHEDHMCKECEQKLPSFMELLKHVAKHHEEEQSGGKDM